MSLRIEEITGNINRDQGLNGIYRDLMSRGAADRILLQRRDATKSRLRVSSERGTDVMIDVPRGTTLRHGDVLYVGDNKILVVEWLPEETMIITMSAAEDWKERVETAAKIGYILGIKHFPLFAVGTEIVVPIEGSKEDLSKAFATFAGINIRFEKRILDVEPEMIGHEHTH